MDWATRHEDPDRSDVGRDGSPVRGWPFVIGWFRRHWVAFWFAALSGYWLFLMVQPGSALMDDVYLTATRRWLAGIDPWATPYQGWFAAPPITLVPMIPFALLPFGRWLLLALAIAAGIATIRLLHKPWYWIMFPPLVISMAGGGIDAWLLPLILVGHGWLAVLGKLYAAVPLALLGRWRPLVIAGIVILVTAPFLPWGSYFAQFPTIRSHLAEQAQNLSAPLYLMPIAIVSLLVMGRERGAWMAVPALWPSTQLYYNTIALPALTPLAAALIAVPSPWCVVGACVLLAIQHRREVSAPEESKPEARDAAAAVGDERARRRPRSTRLRPPGWPAPRPRTRHTIARARARWFAAGSGYLISVGTAGCRRHGS